MSKQIKNIVFDDSALIALFFEEGGAVQKVVDTARDCGVSLWIVASSLPLLELAVRQQLGRAKTDDVIQNRLVGFVNDLLACADVLTVHGFSQPELLLRSIDFSAAQIVIATRVLDQNYTCILTERADFNALGEVSAMTPIEVLRSLLAHGSPVATEAPLPFIDLDTQQAHIRSSLEANVEAVFRHGQYIMGPEVRALEARLEAYSGARHCITVASGTEALLIALMALNIGQGDEVITTPFSFVATAEVIALLGAKPVFVDIEADTGNIDPQLIESAITPRTKAIMPVSLYGQPADMDEINQLASRHGLPVIEDAAQSFGAEYKGRKSCNLSTVGCTSFFPSKPLGCYGDGGAIFTSDDQLAKTIREIRVHGQESRYHHTRIGVGGRMDTLQCAVLLAKLERFDWEVEQRKKIGLRYNQLFAGKLPVVLQRTDRTSVFAQYTVFVENRAIVQEALKQAGIPTAVHYPVPINQQPAYVCYGAQNATPVAAQRATTVLSLPMGPDLGMADQDRIVSVLLGSLNLVD